MKNIKKKFPSYFEYFELPEGAKNQEIDVYRACKTQAVDKGSFTPSFEENNFKHDEHHDKENPSTYSLSTYEKAKDIKRFATMSNEHQKPFKIAKGVTHSSCGLSQRTKERIKKKKDSHVDWWLYEGAEPHKHFEIIDDFEDRYEEIKKKEGLNNE